MLTKYEIEEEELKPKIKKPEPEFHQQYNVTEMQRNYLTGELEAVWRPVTAIQMPNPVYVDYCDVHDVLTIEPIEYSPPTAYTIEYDINHPPF